MNRLPKGDRRGGSADSGALLRRVPLALGSFLLRGRGRDGRLILVLALLSYFGVVLIASLVGGGFDLWRLFGVPTVAPAFLDVSVITSAWECTRQGFDVLVENPCDPWDRPMNYPRAWLIPATLGLGQASTTFLGVAVSVAFFLSVLLVIGRVTTGEAIVTAAALLSPAVMFGVERGNNDLVIFAIVALAVTTMRARSGLLRFGSYALFLLAAVLKLYPVFAWTVLLRQERRHALVALAVTGVPMAAYLAATYDDLRLIGEATPRAISLSYGAAVIVDGVNERVSDVVPALDFLVRPDVQTLLQVVGIAVALGLALWLAGRLPSPAPNESTQTMQRRLDAFWVGATIYVGTFVLGNNWDYRLIFLLFTVPQLVAWIEARGPLAGVSAWALVAMIGALWLGSWLHRLPFPLPLDEVLNWLLFVFFAAVLLRTSPALPAFLRGRVRAMARS